MTRKTDKSKSEAQEQVQKPAELPRKGGSYTRAPDGSLQQTHATKPAEGRVTKKET